MWGQHRWAIGLTSTGVLGLTITGGLTLLGNHFVYQFSHPHELLSEEFFTWETTQDTAEPSPAYQHSLLFQTSDGTLLSGEFWEQPKSAPTVVLCHGYRISRMHLRYVAAIEYACGYNIFLFDFRGHGDSDSVRTSGGKIEVRDLEAAIYVASQQPKTLPGRIILHGFSMGASVALLTPPHPDVVAIIADSPYARSDVVMQRIISYRLAHDSKGWVPMLRWLRHLSPALAWTAVSAGTFLFRMRFGYDAVARPAESFRLWKARAKKVLQQHSIPILLIHTEDDELIPIDHARQIVAQAQSCDVPIETYFTESGNHCGAYRCDPRGYKNAVQAFLARYLGADLPEQHRFIA